MAIDEREDYGEGVSGNGQSSLSVWSSISSLASRTLSALTSRLDFARSQGLSLTSFDGLRDVDVALGYLAPHDLTVSHYRLRYERGGIAEQIVDAFPSNTWAGDLEIYDDPDPEIETAFESQIKSLFDKFSLESCLEEADKKTGIGHYGSIWIGAPGEVSTELGRINGIDSILYLTPLAEDECLIDSKVKSVSDPRYGLPEFYRVTVDQTNHKRVHYTRILHISEGYGLYGKPRLRSVWNLFDDLIKVVGGGAEAAWKRQDPGIQANIPLFDPNGKPIKWDENKLSDLQDQFDEYNHRLTRNIYTQGVDVKLLSSNVSNFGPNAKSILEQIAGTTGIPVRILLGSERGELASTQDRESFDERIEKRRKRFAAPLVRRFIDLLIKQGALPKPKNGEYFIEWNDGGEETSLNDQSVIVERIARANKVQVESGDTEIMTSEEMRDGILGLEPLEESSDDESEDGDNGEETDLEGIEDGDVELIANSSWTLLDHLAVSDPDEPEWKAIHRVADKNRRLLARDIRETWLDSSRSIDEIALESAISSRDSVRVNTILSQLVNDTLSPMLITVGQTRLQTTLIQAGQAALKASKARGSWYIKSSRAKTSNLDSVSSSASTVFEMVFDAVNPRAVTYALTRSSQLVTQITPDTLAGLQSIVSLGTETGIPPRKQVSQIRELVGLRDDQVRAMYNLRRRLEEAKGGSVVKAGKVKIKVPKKGLTADQIEAQVDKYGKRLLNQRSLLISRTECMRSANEGQKELWRQAQDSNLLPDDIKREWIVTDDSRLREEHREMEGQRVGVNEPFSPISEPGSEPACRCSQGLVED